CADRLASATTISAASLIPSLMSNLARLRPPTLFMSPGESRGPYSRGPSLWAPAFADDKLTTVPAARNRLSLSLNAGLENSFDHAFAAVRDVRRLAFGHGLTERLVVAQPLGLGRRVDHGAVGLGRAPEHQPLDQGLVALDLSRRLRVDLGADAGIDA